MIGIGNPYRGDDAAGVCIVRGLRTQLGAIGGPCADTLVCHGEGTELMDSWDGYHRVYLFDAVMAHDSPGRIHRLQAEAQQIPVDFFKYSSHAFSIAEAVELARVLDRLPPQLTVYGVEGENFSHGEGLSPPVQAACRAVIEQVMRELAVAPSRREDRHA